MTLNKIDFVLTWVDGSDVDWIREFDRFYNERNPNDVSDKRYRSWDNLQYWFRGIEKFSPWVNKIYFVTWGHVPPWLNTNHPKLVIVNHSDIIMDKYLPVFNANPIEVNLHRIPGLCEQFVYFNDDTFLTGKIGPERFFKNGKPCDIATFNVIDISGIEHILLNNLKVINKYFNKKSVFLSHTTKWLNYRYKMHITKTLFLLPWKQFTGFYDPHQAQPFLKSTFEAIWAKEKKILQETTASRFRSNTDVNQYLFRYWQLVSAEFSPVDISDSKLLVVRSADECKELENDFKRYKLICLNDEVSDTNEFEIIKKLVLAEFEKILPEKSSFEK